VEEEEERGRNEEEDKEEEKDKTDTCLIFVVWYHYCTEQDKVLKQIFLIVCSIITLLHLYYLYLGFIFLLFTVKSRPFLHTIYFLNTTQWMLTVKYKRIMTMDCKSHSQQLSLLLGICT
jgi:lipopolysaccharide/colanic/teichoic acid biosynthesis glycosyltransferase